MQEASVPYELGRSLGKVNGNSLQYLEWEISQTEEPVRLSHKIVRYDLVTKHQLMKNKFVTTQKKTQENLGFPD